jgi:hypothetical protein
MAPGSMNVLRDFELVGDKIPADVSVSMSPSFSLVRITGEKQNLT